MATFHSTEAWSKAMKKNFKEYDEANLKEPAKLAAWGLSKAKAIVPKDTTSYLQALSAKVIKGNKNSKAFIFVRSMDNAKYIGKSARVPRYAAIQHKMGRHSRYQAKTGDPHWAFTVQRAAEKKTREKINVHIQKFIGK